MSVYLSGNNVLLNKNRTAVATGVKCCPPTISSISPTSGGSGGGTVVDIYGSHFIAGAKVYFGGGGSIGGAYINSGHIQATTPAHSVGTVNVDVFNADGCFDAAICPGCSATLGNSFTYIAQSVDHFVISGPFDLNCGSWSGQTVTAKDASGITVGGYNATVNFQWTCGGCPVACSDNQYASTNLGTYQTHGAPGGDQYARVTFVNGVANISLLITAYAGCTGCGGTYLPSTWSFFSAGVSPSWYTLFGAYGCGTCS